MRRSPGKNIRTSKSSNRRVKGGNLKDTTQKIEKEPEVLAQEGKDPGGENMTMKGREVGKTTVMIIMITMIVMKVGKTTVGR